MPLSKSPTQIVVGGIIGIALLVVAFKLAGWVGGAILATLLLYEGWTLVNAFPNDTISEIIWGMSNRPMIPFIFGAAFAWSIQSGTLASPWLIAAFGFLLGHFFFQRVGN